MSSKCIVSTIFCTASYTAFHTIMSLKIYKMMILIAVSIYLLLLSSSFTAASYMCSLDDESYVYHTPEVIHPAALHKQLYTDYGSDITLLDLAHASNPILRSTSRLTIGTEICLAQPLPSTFSSIRADSVEPHAAPWHVWQVYGSIRGFTLPEFVGYNLERYDGHDRSSVPVSFLRIYQAHPTLTSYYFNKGFSFEQRSDVFNNNTFLLDAIDRFDAQTLIDYIGDFEQDQKDEISQSLYPSLEYYQDDYGLDLRIVLIQRSVVEKVSLPLASIGNYAFKNKFGSADESQRTHVMLVVVEGLGLVYTYPSDSKLIEEDPQFMDDTLAKALAYMESYDQESDPGYTFSDLLFNLVGIVTVNIDPVDTGLIEDITTG